MTNEEYELFRDRILEYASDLPMKKCPRCNGTGRRTSSNPAGSFGKCMLCNGARQITEDLYEQHQSKAIFQ